MESKKTILLIDDEPDFQSTVKFFLENNNYLVDTAVTGLEGLAKASRRPDLILLDLKMPGMDGHEVCRKLKSDRATEHIPVIMLTSQKQTLDKVQALNLGAVDYIGKDFSFEEILARINVALRLASANTNVQSNDERNKRIMELRDIIDNKRLTILFQPIVRLSTREPIGYEALTRGPADGPWQNALYLFNFASEVNMFEELDATCRRLAAQQATFLHKKQMLFVNTDPAIINTSDFQRMAFLEGTSLLPSQICFEITERTCVKNFAQLSAQLNRFKSQGIKIAIDDVGSGYSSLSAVAELTPEFVKADISLIRSINESEAKRNLVMAIQSFAQRLNSDLIAEGVETEEEYATLVGLGFAFGQGYLFGRPAPAPHI